MILDTNALMWSIIGDASKVSSEVQAEIDARVATGDAAVSAITFWEMRHARRKNNPAGYEPGRTKPAAWRSFRFGSRTPSALDQPPGDVSIGSPLAEAFPFVEEAGVGGAHQIAELGGEAVEGIVDGSGRGGLDHGLVAVGQIAQ